MKFLKNKIKEVNIKNEKNDFKLAAASIEKNLKISKKPLILIGDGVRQAGVEKEIIEFSRKK